MRGRVEEAAAEALSETIRPPRAIILHSAHRQDRSRTKITGSALNSAKPCGQRQFRKLSVREVVRTDMRSSQATRSPLAGSASQEARGRVRRRSNRVAARASRSPGGRRLDMRSDRRTACGTTPEATTEHCEDRTTRPSPPECCSNLQAPQRRVCQRRVAGTTYATFRAAPDADVHSDYSNGMGSPHCADLSTTQTFRPSNWVRTCARAPRSRRPL